MTSAAVEWVMYQGLATASDDQAQSTSSSKNGDVWTSCEEVLGCLEAGVFDRTNDAEALLNWFLEAGHEKSVPSARVGALHLLIASLPHCPVCRASLSLCIGTLLALTSCPSYFLHTQHQVLSASFERLTQLLRSCMSTASSSTCRRLACDATAALIHRAYEDDQPDARQQLQEVLRRLVMALLSCTSSEEADAMVHASALSALSSCASIVGSPLKPYASKMETSAYDGLDSSEPALRLAAAQCLAYLPSVLSDGSFWTNMLMGLTKEAATTLKQV